MTELELAAKRREAMLGVTIVVCESCDCTIDDANFTSMMEADDFAATYQRADGRVLCDWCADPKNLERLRQAVAKTEDK